MGKHLPEVLVTDIEMPKMSGLELTAGVKELYPDTRALILTTFTSGIFAASTGGRTVAATENDGAVPAAVKCITGGARTLFARTYGGGAEAGGDVGGVINAVGPQTTNLPFPSTHVGLHQ
jgi:hypothetical protein